MQISVLRKNLYSFGNI